MREVARLSGSGHPGEPFPRVGFIVTNLTWPAARVIAFYNQRGTAEQWINEGKNAVKWTRLSCRSMAANGVRLQLSRPGLQSVQLHTHPRPTRRGGKLVTDHHPEEAGEDRRQGRRARPLCRLPDAEVAVPHELYGRILALIESLRPRNRRHADGPGAPRRPTGGRNVCGISARARRSLCRRRSDQPNGRERQRGCPRRAHRTCLGRDA